MLIKFSNNKFNISNKYFSYVIEISQNKDVLNTYFGAPIDCDNIKTPYYFPAQWQPFEDVDGNQY